MPSFDIVSRTDLTEVDNALQGVGRDIAQRYDFKGSRCSIERKDEILTILADNDQKLKQMHELLKGNLARRKVEAAALEYQSVEKAAGTSVRQVVAIRQGVSSKHSKQIVKALKSSKLKVQAAIQGDELRITGKKRDDLQGAIDLVKGLDLDQPLQYLNFRD